jgi:peptidoglycan hydrolase-like protein with peptidoglycan-binding domain
MVMTAALSGLTRADEPASPAPVTKSADSEIRVRTTHVREVQLALLAAGHDPGPIDGIMGPRTKAALRQYIAVPPPQVPSRPEWTLAPSRVSEPREAR